MSNPNSIANLKPRPWPKGLRANPSGRSKAFVRVRRRFQAALDGRDSGEANSLANVILRHAFDDDSPKQAHAWDIVLAYGVGSPPKDLTPEAVEKMAEAMVEKMLGKARQVAAEKALANTAGYAIVEPGGNYNDEGK